MSSAFIGLIATIIGAIFAAFLNEMYKRHRDACATAAALAGELASYRQAYEILEATIPSLIKRVQEGFPLGIPAQDPPVDIVFPAYVDKLGLLGPDLAEQTSRVYGKIRGFRSAFWSLSRAPADADTHYLEAALLVGQRFMASANQDSGSLIESLKQIARKPFGTDLRNRLKSVFVRDRSSS